MKYVIPDLDTLEWFDGTSAHSGEIRWTDKVFADWELNTAEEPEDGTEI